MKDDNSINGSWPNFRSEQSPRGFRNSAMIALTLASLSAGFAASPPTTTFTEVSINSATSVYFNLPPDFIRDTTGADVQLSAVGSHALAFCGTGGCGINYVIKTVDDDVLANASLANGTLKTKAYLKLGANTFVFGAGVPVGYRNGSSDGTATFADSFRTFSANRPFLWTSGTTATFHFAVTGQSTVTGTVPNPSTSAPPKPIDQILAGMVIDVYQPGAIDLIRQLEDFDFSAYPNFAAALAAFNALNNQLNAKFITSDYRYFGQAMSPYFTPDPSKTLPIDPITPTNVDFTFTPGGDFDWLVRFDSSTQIDASLQNVSVLLDFSHSMAATYQGPPGTATYSASGLFPGTLPLSEIGKCELPQGDWKNNPAAWPVSSLTLGNQTYNQAQLLNILGNAGGGDASMILAVQLIAAKLNIANGSYANPAKATITAADALLQGVLPLHVKPNTANGQLMTAAGSILDNYNQQLLTPACIP